jgi:glutamate dehydrogenase
LDSGILLKVPLLDRDHLYPEVPDAIFFIKGKNFIAFNIRFRELARGGVRTLMPMDADKRAHQHRDVFRECYLLAYTQQKKNKDIPEGGAKTVVFVKKYSAFERDLEVERSIAVKLMDKESLSASMEERRLTRVRRLLFDAQQSFCDALLDLLVWDDQKHVLVTTNVVDYHGKEELVFLGPDENMLNQMIEWISLRSEERGYRVGLSFMSGKKELGINHKAYGVTSLGVHEYLKEILRSKGFDKASFTVKMSGGPDGDVAGNQLINLIKDFGDRVAVLGVVDGTGLLMDPGGISQQELKRLFEVGQGVSSFDPTFLGIGACLLLIQEKRDSQRGVQEILCLRCESTGVKEVWLGASEANRFYHQELLKLKTDVFLPCGGRPRTLNRKNWRQFCDDAGEPSARIIVEGANLYLDDQAREELQSLGVLIVKDASANKCGVICSSYEILAGLICGPEEFKGIKEDLVVDVMAKLVARAKKEARLLIGSEQGDAIALSDRVSDAINRWTDLIIQELQCSCSDKEYQALLLEVVRITAPETLKKNYTARIITLPKLYKDAMIASTLASSLVYHRGVDYQPKLIHSLMREVEEGLLGD